MNSTTITTPCTRAYIEMIGGGEATEDIANVGGLATWPATVGRRRFWQKGGRRQRVGAINLCPC